MTRNLFTQPEQYVEKVLQLYLALPDTPSRPRPQDRQLARSLFRKNVPLTALRSAFLLATARRSFRSDPVPRLPPIRSLHYFLPVLAEILQIPLNHEYLRFLDEKLHPRPSGQKTAVPDGR